MSRVYIYPLTVFYFLATEMSVFCYHDWFYRRNFPYLFRPIFPFLIVLIS
ncbi:BCN_G0004140.mRNA.1.CDS.1 [Saccharomyces cerevisiae]|nr:BCN_G0004140.mRNA.1.CDS.1 [Saccharomyces cerevisiae]CAI6503698.1 ALI_collapsed_G0004100.mRNA.1.CDS.1 [Saccharomyces cerevisiae]CAI7048577.1 BCN_G0004140.mRNA.1.CDS.1 [Saccharomyces cerevisiae]